MNSIIPGRIDNVGKLVRDGVPDIIRRSGRTPRVTVLSGQAYLAALRDKLLEEAAELCAARDSREVIEEAADVLEVLRAIAVEHGQSLEHLIDVARRKRACRGGFEMRLSLDDLGTSTESP